MTLLKPRIGHQYPVAVEAYGSTIVAENGRRYLDGCSGAIACSLGYNHPYVIERITKALSKVSFAYRTQFTTTEPERLAERLCSKFDYHAAFFVNSGSEAVETATRIAQRYWRERGEAGRTQVLSRKISYHGSTTRTLGLSGHWPRRREIGTLAETPTVPTPYCYRCPLGKHPNSCQLACARAVEEQILERGPENVAAFLLEPIVGASGAAIVPPSGYLGAVYKICRRHGVLVIADEVLTGMGRTGRWLASQEDGEQADIVVLGKGMNAGYVPLSAVLVSQNIYDALSEGSGQFGLGHTHSNHPLSCAVGNAVLDVLENEELVSRSSALGETIRSRLKELASEHLAVGDVRGCGTFFGLELVRSDIDRRPHLKQAAVADRVVSAAMQSDLVVYPSTGFAGLEGGDAVIFAPPFNVTYADLDLMIDRLDAALRAGLQNIYADTMEAHDAT